jgi:3-hydroxybutyryl-CoA dehydrogenase
MSDQAGIGIVGAGRMGRGIATACVLAGTPCLLIDLKPRTDEAFARIAAAANAEVAGDLRFLSSLGLLEAAQLPALMASMEVLSQSAAASRLAACDIIFEGLPETLAAKEQALAWIGQHASATAIVASTTSTLDVDTLADMLPGPERFLNAHWLNPAHLMPIVEIATGRHTAANVTATMRAALLALGKAPVVCKASPGYIVPRIQALAMNEAARLVEEGVASAEDIDTAVRKGFGLRFAVLGLLEFIDWGGNDILYYASQHLSQSVDANRYAAPGIIQKNMHEGRNGLRDGLGFYDYRGRDVDAYRKQRLEQFVRLMDFLNLLPAGLKRPAPVAGAERA